MKRLGPCCAIMLLLANAAFAQEPAQPAPAQPPPTPAPAKPLPAPRAVKPRPPDPGPPLAPITRVSDYHAIFQQCTAGGVTRLAIRAMRIDDSEKLLAVDPATLTTSVEAARDWTCTPTDDEAQKDTRFVRAIDAAAKVPASHPDFLHGAGLSHGTGGGSFVTGDLCPSLLPLDRGFLDMLAQAGPHTPVALSVSGLWLTHHAADFHWLQEQEHSGALAITWVNHSWHHPYDPTRPMREDFLLRPGLDIEREILDTERMLIAQGETPSIFFRFPGLVSSSALAETLRHFHLVVLSADAWLLLSPPLRPGAIVLVHPNGNEPQGLRLFARLMAKGTMPRPFRPLSDAP